MPSVFDDDLVDWGVRLIVGVTGLYCSGKDTFAEYLEKKGFVHFSLSDLIREDMERKGIEITRDNLIKHANKLREKYGHGVLGERALHKMQSGDYVISSIRHPAEAKELMKAGAFFLIEVTAPIKIRLKRIKARKREEDPMTLSELKKKEKSESQKSGAGQQLTNVMKMAKIKVANDKNLKKLQGKIDKLLKDLRKREKKMPSYIRPTWDEYFIGLVAEIGKRGTCDRGRAGCVIVKDKRIMTTGYVGSPVGVKHCDEIGHELKTTLHEDGTKSKHCVRTTHAEQNAICQAARYGISIDGATLYCKMEPCYICAKMIINAGIKRVVCALRYHGSKESRRIFKEAGVRLEVLSDEMLIYKDMK